MTSQVAKDIRGILAQNIREARTGRGWTQRELSRRLDLDQLAISRWERARVIPAPENLAALATVFGREISWFYEDHRPGAAA